MPFILTIGFIGAFAALWLAGHRYKDGDGPFDRLPAGVGPKPAGVRLESSSDGTKYRVYYWPPASDDRQFHVAERKGEQAWISFWFDRKSGKRTLVLSLAHAGAQRHAKGLGTMKAAALALPALAAAALFAFTGKAKAKPPVPAPVKPPVIVPSPQGAGTVPARMSTVIATGDPNAIRFEAGRLRQEGYTAQAAELERVAAVIESERGNQPAKPPLTLPPPPVVIVNNPPPPPVFGPPLPPAAPLLAGATLRKVSPAPFNPRVVLLQQRLLALGYPIMSGADGKFGPHTELAVKGFQRANGLAVDGIVGAATQTALMSPNAKRAPAVATATPAPTVTPTPVLPAGPAPSSSAGRAPTITPLLRSLPSLLRNGKPAFKAPASSGQAVKDWQQVLFDLGFLKSKPDGKFGDATELGTRQFQTAANSVAAKSGKPKLSVDGIVGPATVARAAEARIMTTGPATFAGGSFFGDDPSTGALLLAPRSPLPDTPLPGVIAPMAPTAPSAERALAARVTHMLLSVPQGREDRMLVGAFQTQEGLRPTGYYGPATALVLAQRYGIVPPKPSYWTDSRTARSKQNYRDQLRMLGERDPQRREEWIRAASV